MMEKAGDSVFINMREVVNRYQLKEGRYVVVPSTYDPHEAGRFMIRIFTEKSSNARYLLGAEPELAFGFLVALSNQVSF